MKRIEFVENKINFVVEVTDKNEVKFLHFSALPFDESTIGYGKDSFSLVEVLVSGLDRTGERQGPKYIHTAPGDNLKYKDLRDYRNEFGRKLEIIMCDENTGLEVCSNFQFYDGISVVRSWTEAFNNGEEELGLEYISSFAITGIEKEGLSRQDEKLLLYIPHNAWQKEFNWNMYRLTDLGLSVTQPLDRQHSSKVIEISNVGNWSTKEYLPMGYLENKETNSGLFWQIEHNGSWHWQISDKDGHLYINLSGPDEYHCHWWKKLKPGESFVSVPVGVGVTTGGIDNAIAELTKYRRIIRRKNLDNEKLGIIFNDYMNCLYGDPTEEKELPLIDKAKEVGCEYYCIDCGWYSDGYWWDGVGEWLPSKRRFPNGFKNLIDYIRSKGMIPGVWLELEVMGIKCRLAKALPDNWFFVRHGKRVYDRSRFQLDFRNPEVRKYADSIIDRLVNEYGVGYIKMDYNIEPGIGTEINTDSFGDGLLGHERAYLDWLDGIFKKYPDLVIENCSSGGLRLDYAMLSRYSIQSTSDQEDYRYYATIAANAPSGLTPEQAAIWAYPIIESNDEEVIFNMVNALLLRIHLSGNLDKLEERQLKLVKEALEIYKSIRNDIKKSLPFWPLGLSHYNDSWISFGLKCENRSYLAVWRRNSQMPTCELPIAHLKNKNVNIKCIYPKEENCKYKWNKESGILTVNLPNIVSARLFKIEY
ncbi:glycoside hydrolase family 36 protein [Thermoanaerobacterium thermosaccharolyticum]|uniref:glycoside hydrolase family 36 protein n=1 Tax=Thermoanaerobacterium thermosaccharolyticum TaxID=1517 RepID=UPI003DA833B9